MSRNLQSLEFPTKVQVGYAFFERHGVEGIHFCAWYRTRQELAFSFLKAEMACAGKVYTTGVHAVRG